SGAQSQDPIGGCAPRAGDSDARKRGFVFGDRSDGAVLPRLYQPLATAIPRRSLGRSAAAIPGTTADGADARDGGPRPGKNAATSCRRQYALEYAQTGARAQDSP